MSIYNHIQDLEPYFHQIRKHNDYFVLDLNLPRAWDFKYVQENKGIGVKVNKTNDNAVSVSLFTNNTKENTDELLVIVKGLVQHNKELEEKVKLLEIKKIELQRLFESNSLEKLKQLTFNMEENFDDINLENIKNDEESTGGELVQETTEEG